MNKNRAKKRSGKRRSKNQRQSGATSSGGAVHVTSHAAFERHLQGPEPVVVDFWAPWCAPCRAMAPTFDKVASAFEGQVRFLKVNTEELPELAAAFGVRSIPTVAALAGDEVVDSHIGLATFAGLTRMAQRALDRSRGVTLAGRIKRFFIKQDQTSTRPSL